MDTLVTESLKGDIPEVIEEYLEHGVMKCIAFNRRGTYLAAGCSDGSCILWDFETRGIVKELRNEDCVDAITSICWSKCGNHILVSAADRTLVLWDVVSEKKIARVKLEKTPLHARLHPDSSAPPLCLVSPVYSAPLIVDLCSGSTTLLPVSFSEGEDGLSDASQNNVSDESAPQTPACFNKHGDLVYLGNSKGEILIIDHRSIKVHAIVSITGGAAVKNIVFSRNCQFLLTVSNDRTIRIFENRLPAKGSLKVLDKMGETLNDLGVFEKLKAIGSKSLVLSHEVQDSVTKVQWKVPCFVRDGQLIVCGSAGKAEHKIYIWDHTGHLVKILEGPKEALIDLVWHPIRATVVSVSITGLVYIWAKDYTQSWSAFAPNFKEIRECEEYVEREDEFDIMPEVHKVKRSDFEFDEEVDIVAVEKDYTSSDSEELCFLPVIPCPHGLDTPEQHCTHTGDSLKLVDTNLSASPLSAQGGPNGRNHESSSIEGIDNSATEDANAARSRRHRRPPEKFLELQAEKVKKRR